MSNTVNTRYYDNVDKCFKILDPGQFNIVIEGQRGQRKYNPYGMINYLEYLGIVHDGKTSFFQWQSDYIRDDDSEAGLNRGGGCYVRISEEEIGHVIQRQQRAVQIFITKQEQQNTINNAEQTLDWKGIEPKLRHSFEQYYGKEHYSRYFDVDGNLSIVAFDDGWMNLSDSKRWYAYLEPDPCFFITESERIHTQHPYGSRQSTRALYDILGTIIEDDDSIRSLLEQVGYILFSRTMFPPYIFHFYGKGRTGKSLIADWIQSILGQENVSRLSILSLSKDFGQANLIGKRLNIATETETSIASNYTPINTELIKQLSGGEEINANRKHKSFVDFENTAKLLFCSNNQLVLGDQSSGMNRRIITWRFKKEQSNNSDIKDILYDPTIKLQLVEEQLYSWQNVRNNKGILLSDMNKQENKKREAFDSFNSFIQNKWIGMGEKAILDDIGETHPVASDLYKEYVEFCAENRFMPLGKIRFNDKIEKELGAVKKRLGSGIYWDSDKR